MNEKNNIDFTTQIKEILEPRLKDQFITGMIAGWNACTQTLYNNCKNMSSAKTIKAYLKKESENKHEKSIKPKNSD